MIEIDPRSLRRIPVASLREHTFASMNFLLNPVYNALLSKDAHLGFGSDTVKCFDEEVSPFIGFAHDNVNGFDEVYEITPHERKILYANPAAIAVPPKWKLAAHIEGLQFVFDDKTTHRPPSIQPVLLNTSHVEEMIALARLTKPGPFDKRTIEFGHYHGIFADDKLVAMTGQRMHVENYTEISAVCTHPDHLGKGYAAALLAHQMDIILDDHQIPFLHSRADNTRAIEIYERLGFKASGPMHFYFMKK